MCGQPSHLHGTFKVFTGHFLMFEAYSALIHVPIFGQKTTLEELKKQALKIQQTSDCVSCVCMCKCCRAKEALQQTARVRGTLKSFKMLRGMHTYAHQWKSLESAHRLAYLTSQVLQY